MSGHRNNLRCIVVKCDREAIEGSNYCTEHDPLRIMLSGGDMELSAYDHDLYPGGFAGGIDRKFEIS